MDAKTQLDEHLIPNLAHRPATVRYGIPIRNEQGVLTGYTYTDDLADVVRAVVAGEGHIVTEIDPGGIDYE